MHHRTCRHDCTFNANRKHADRTDCVDEESHDKVVAECQDQHSCQVPPTNEYFGDTCKDTYKYLDVTYECNCAGWLCVIKCFVMS